MTMMGTEAGKSMNERERKAYEGLGETVVGMIRDLGVAPGNNAYARKTVTFPDGTGGNGSVVLIICKNATVASAAESGIAAQFAVEDAIPRSEVN